MSHKKSRSRSVGLILIGLMLGAVTISPAFANHTPKHTKKMVKKVKKALNKKIKKTNGRFADYYTKTETDAKFESGDTVQKLGASVTKVTAGAPDVLLLTVGPFTLWGRCTSEDFEANGAPLEHVARILIKTTVNDAAVDSDNGSDDDFDIGEEVEIAEQAGTNPPVPGLNSENDDSFKAVAPDGSFVAGLALGAGTDLHGADCVFFGGVLYVP